jgi:hypothetical protein
MSAIEAVQLQKARELQALEVFAGKYCKRQLEELFNNDIASKGSPDPRYAAYAHGYKNNILYVLDRVMSFSTHPATSRETEEFMEEYTRRHAEIITKYEAIIHEEEEIARKAAEASAAMEQEATSRRLPPGNIRSYLTRKGGRRRRRKTLAKHISKSSS